jgi:uncharacterized protein YjiS (DUF1127 family)
MTISILSIFSYRKKLVKENFLRDMKDCVKDRVKDRVKVFYRNYTTRKQLTSLSNEALKDIGITRDSAVIQAKKPFYR